MDHPRERPFLSIPGFEVGKWKWGSPRCKHEVKYDLQSRGPRTSFLFSTQYWKKRKRNIVLKKEIIVSRYSKNFHIQVLRSKLKCKRHDNEEDQMIKKTRRNEQNNPCLQWMQVLGLSDRAENDYNLDTQEYWHKEFQQRKRKSNINFGTE